MTRQIELPCACLLLALICGGCLSIADSPAPRFYALRTVPPDPAAKKLNAANGMIVGIGPVKMPEYLNRPQMVTLTTNSLLHFAQFDRWGEPLEFALPRIISEDLSALMPDAVIAVSPGNINMPARYQVVMNIVRMDCRIGQDLNFAAQWTVINPENKKMIFMKKSEFVRPIEPHTYAGLAETLSLACAALSAEIAEELSRLAEQPNNTPDL